MIAVIHAAWDEVGLTGAPPEIDLDQSLVIVATGSFGSGCEPEFVDVEVSATAGTIQLVRTLDPDRECAADERWFGVAVAIDRLLVADGGFSIDWAGQRFPVR